MASPDRITVALDADIVAQARAQIGERGERLGDAAVVERTMNAYLLRRTVEGTQAAAGLAPDAADEQAYDELAAMRRERRGAP